jgi:hypothetical protein
LEAELNLDPDSNPGPGSDPGSDPELITDQAGSGSGCTTLLNSPKFAVFFPEGKIVFVV